MINRMYEIACRNGSDINEHMPVLKHYADQCEHVTEFGVRLVVSTWAFVASKAKTVLSYDVSWNDKVDECVKICARDERPWTFTKASTLEIEIEHTDLLFIDTLHTYEQLIQELNMHNEKVRKYIIMHDTVSYGRRGEHGESKGLMDAVEEFLDNNKDWEMHEHRENCNGLTVLRRV